MYWIYIFLGFLAAGSVGYALWEFSKRSRLAGLISACFWIALISGLLNVYNFNLLNLLGAWAICALVMVAAYSYSTVALEQREKEIAQCKSTIESLKRKDSLTTEEENRLHKLEMFVSKNIKEC